MTSVILVAPDSTQVTVSNLTDFNGLIYGLGYRPLTGTIPEARATLQSGVTTGPDHSAEVVRVSDLENADSDARTSLGTALANEVAAGTSTFAMGLKAAFDAAAPHQVARRLPPLDVALPSVMATPPTFAVTGPGGNSPINAGSPTHIAFDDARVTHLGQLNTTVTQFSTNYLQNTMSGADTPPPCADEFDFYGDDLAIWFRCASTNQSQFWVWVDGHPATAAPVVLTTNTSGGSLSYYRITFASVALRRIKIYRYLADWGGIDIKPTHAVAPAPRWRPKLAVLGDSFIVGVGDNLTNLSGMTQTIGQLLGMDTFWAGQGGTGYVANGGGGNKAPYTDATRIGKIVTAAPDYVLVFGSENDDGLSGIQAAAASVYTQLASGLPNSKVIVVGPPALGSPVSANRAANSAAVKAAAQAAPNVLGFIDPTSDAQGQPWVTGSGTASAPAGNGSADVFTSGAVPGHPTQAGHDYYARRIAQGVVTLLAA